MLKIEVHSYYVQVDLSLNEFYSVYLHLYILYDQLNLLIGMIEDI